MASVTMRPPRYWSSVKNHNNDLKGTRKEKGGKDVQACSFRAGQLRSWVIHGKVLGKWEMMASFC